MQFHQRRSSRPFRSGFKAVTYRYFGWWATDLLLFIFWVIPLAAAILIGGFGFLSAYVLKAFKEWWSDEPQEDPWTGEKKKQW